MQWNNVSYYLTIVSKHYTEKTTFRNEESKIYCYKVFSKTRFHQPIFFNTFSLNLILSIYLSY